MHLSGVNIRSLQTNSARKSNIICIETPTYQDHTRLQGLSACRHKHLDSARCVCCQARHSHRDVQGRGWRWGGGLGACRAQACSARWVDVQLNLKRAGGCLLLSIAQGEGGFSGMDQPERMLDVGEQLFVVDEGGGRGVVCASARCEGGAECEQQQAARDGECVDGLEKVH